MTLLHCKSVEVLIQVAFQGSETAAKADVKASIGYLIVSS